MFWSLFYTIWNNNNLSLQTHLARHELIRSTQNCIKVKVLFPKHRQITSLFVCLIRYPCIYAIHAYKQHTNCNWKWRNNEEENEKSKKQKKWKYNTKATTTTDLKKLKICAKETALTRFMRFLLKSAFILLLSLNITKALIGIV